MSENSEIKNKTPDLNKSDINKLGLNELGFTEKVTIANKRGLHARASARFVKLAETFDANIMVSKDKNQVLGTSIMGLLLLAAAKGEVVTIQATGPQAQEAINELKKLIMNKFEEDT